MLLARALAAGALLALGACTAGPDFHPAPPPAVDRYTPVALPDGAFGAADGGPSQRFSRGAPVAERWWTLFQNPELDALENEALSANSDLRSAQAALRSLTELYRAQHAVEGPDIQLAAGAVAGRTPKSLAPILNAGTADYTLYTPQLNITYVFDLFGGVRRQTEAAAAQAENQRYLTAGVYLTLTANVAGAALQLASLNTQLDEARAVAAANRRTLASIERQRRLGEASTLDVAAALSNAEQADALAPPLQKQIDLQRDLLATLIGRPAAQPPASTFRLRDFSLPADLPVSLPSDLVRRRPDVRAAEANVHVASAEVGVAAAARLPSFLITATPGAEATTAAGLFSSSNLFYTLGGTLTQSLFDGGALKHRKRAADAALDQAKAQYAGVVLGALQNVADALQAILGDTAALQHAAAAQSAAERALTLTRAQQNAGQAGALPALTAEAAERQAELALTQAQAARYSDTVALYQALGGGWRAE